MRTNKLYLLPVLVGCIALSACQSMQPGTGSVKREGGVIDITGGIINANQPAPNANPTPKVSDDSRVTVYPLDGPVHNPLSIERYRSVVENTTSGGYTVFDESVTVYPLPGDPVPSVVPPHAVPPFGTAQNAPRIGAPTSLTKSSLPPVPTVEVGVADPYSNPPVGGIMRQPATLTQDYAPPAQAPSATARAPLTTYDTLTEIVDVTVATPNAVDESFVYATNPSAMPSSGISGNMAAGRKSGPSLTGY